MRAFLLIPAAVTCAALAACGRSDLTSSLQGEAASGGGGGAGATGGQGGAVVSSSVGPGAGTGGNQVCGDGVVGPGEQCDDGNNLPDDGCLFCANAFCGDGFVFAGVEACDDANTSPNDDCLFCQFPFCGDGFVWLGHEACDDGNSNNNDGCKNDCSLSTCGNGLVEAGEQCDDGNGIPTDSCILCLFAQCGDGFVWIGQEQCDDGNLSNSDACVLACVLAQCGDGFLHAGVEQCDDGNLVNGDGCQSNCKLPACGDGIVDPGEQCDDGNTNQGDGCHNNCMFPACGDGILDPGEACDDGNTSNTDGCVSGCKPAQCGDGFLYAGVEQCDDGNLVNGDGCSSMCMLPICGDGIQEPPEACDLGPANANRPALLVSWDVKSSPVTPIDRSTGAALFYNYFSASSHTGYEELYTSRLYFYRDVTTGILSLIMHHGIDFDTSMQQQPPTDVFFNITGLPSVTAVALADDGPGEFNKTGATTAQGNWHFQGNSDGGVISGLPFPGNWSIDISPTFTNPITAFQFVNGDDSLLHLYIVPVNLTAFDTPSPCRPDCTIPTCGDGVLDGGEVCDDGNTQGGDGCAADCKSLN